MITELTHRISPATESLQDGTAAAATAAATAAAADGSELRSGQPSGAGKMLPAGNKSDGGETSVDGGTSSYDDGTSMSDDVMSTGGDGTRMRDRTSIRSRTSIADWTSAGDETSASDGASTGDIGTSVTNWTSAGNDSMSTSDGEAPTGDDRTSTGDDGTSAGNGNAFGKIVLGPTNPALLYLLAHLTRKTDLDAIKRVSDSYLLQSVCVSVCPILLSVRKHFIK